MIFLSFKIPRFYSGAKDWKFNVSEEDNRVAKKLCTISKNAFGKKQRFSRPHQRNYET